MPAQQLIADRALDATRQAQFDSLQAVSPAATDAGTPAVGGEAFGRPLSDVVRPVGMALLAGAFLFGIGAQLASACSSGSLAGLGNGKLRYLVVVAFMIAGATLGSAHMGWWEARPGWVSFSMLREWGPAAGIAGNLSLLGLIALGTVWLERSRHGRLYRAPNRERHWLRGPWPMS